MKCWICGQPINDALSVPTIDPGKRVCLSCDGQVERRTKGAWNGMGKQLSLLREALELERATVQ